MMKVWHFAHLASAIQRWAYITPSCMLAAWSTLLSATFCLIIGSRKTGTLPVALAPLLSAAVAGLGLCVLWVRAHLLRGEKRLALTAGLCGCPQIPLVSYPLAPPMVPYAVTLAFGLGAIAASASPAAASPLLLP